MRDMIAGLVIGAGSVFESSATDPYSSPASSYDELSKSVIYRRIQKMYGIPTLIHAGEDDPFWSESTIGLEQCYRDIQSL